MGWFNHLVILLILLFGIVGAVVIGTTIHEIIHLEDLKNFVNSEGLCVLNIPLNITWETAFSASLGYFSYGGNYNDTQLNEIRHKSEIKAYSITLIVLTIFFVCFFTVLIKYWDGIYLRKENQLTFDIPKN